MKELNKFLSESITLLEEQQCNVGLDKERLNLLDQLNKLVENLSLSGVSQQSELLIAWEKRGYEEEEWNLVEEIKIEFINNFLSNL